MSAVAVWEIIILIIGAIASAREFSANKGACMKVLKASFALWHSLLRLRELYPMASVYL
jgi:hypothetical protein